jgi:hypothetical protein
MWEVLHPFRSPCLLVASALENWKSHHPNLRGVALKKAAFFVFAA